MQDCVFCKIVQGQVPCYKVYEDELFLAFLDIFPHTKGHTLLIPKDHHRWVYDVPQFGKYWEAAKKVTDKILSTLHPQFVSYLTYGLDVPHAHIHLIPRYTGGTKEMAQTVKLDKDELQTICSQIQIYE